MLEKALKDLDDWNDDTRARCKKWFGDDDEATRKLVRERTQKVLDKLDKMDPATNFVKAEPGEEDCYGYVYPTKEDKLYLGDLFATAPATGTDSKAGTLIHEVSHYQSTGRTRDVKMADGTTAYGHDNCEQLAKDDPDKAKTNADSFEFFVEGG
jgi:peptidyl-Lys metalloendopeptidase